MVMCPSKCLSLNKEALFKRLNIAITQNISPLSPTFSNGTVHCVSDIKQERTRDVFI